MLSDEHRVWLHLRIKKLKIAGRPCGIVPRPMAFVQPAAVVLSTQASQDQTEGPRGGASHSSEHAVEDVPVVLANPTVHSDDRMTAAQRHEQRRAKFRRACVPPRYRRMRDVPVGPTGSIDPKLGNAPSTAHGRILTTTEQELRVFHGRSCQDASPSAWPFVGRRPCSPPQQRR